MKAKNERKKSGNGMAMAEGGLSARAGILLTAAANS